MKKTSSIILILAMFILPLAANTVNARFSNDDYGLEAIYNNEIVPGDAVFVRMKFQNTKNHKKAKTDKEHQAVLYLYRNEKLVDKSVFYSLGKPVKKNGVQEYLTGLPLSSWLTDANYYLKVAFTQDEDTFEFILPVVFKNREFNSETVHLDAKNTAIKTNNSPERVSQIDKLNAILETINPESIHTTKKFISPTTSTRYTSWFGDRRVYAYSNGKSSTSLHYGNDYGIPTGSPVSACADGKVVMAENRISTGFSIVIEHLPGLYSLYYHLDSMNVEEGQMVKAGDLIGKSGCTGLATGPHLHWEMRLNMCAVRPEYFLDDFAFSGEAPAK